MCSSKASCCTSYTTQGYSSDCCAPGTVCCPNFSRRKLPTGNVKIAGTTPLHRKKDNANVTSCADPAADFCCGGFACPTETLCCAGDVQLDPRAGCCYGFPSSQFSCVDDGNGNSVCPTHNNKQK